MTTHYQGRLHSWSSQASLVCTTAMNIVRAAAVMSAAPVEATQHVYGGTWPTIGMARKARRPLAIVRRGGEVVRERWDAPAVPR